MSTLLNATAAVGILALGAISYGYGFEPGKGILLPEERCRASSAYHVTKQFLEPALKAPATAEYPRLDEVKISAVEPGRAGDDCAFEIEGWVDSENSFGALIRTRYTARVALMEAGGVPMWRLTAIEERN